MSSLPDVPVRQAVAWVGSGGSGGSHPIVVRTDDGGFAHVKLQANPQSTRSLVNDWIGTVLGRLAGAPVPRPVLVHVPFEALRDLAPLTRVRWRPGLQFGTEWLPEARPVTRRDVGRLANADDLPLAALFESWVYNEDLKWSHLLTVPDPAGRRLVVADHGFIFPGGPRWTPGELSREARRWPPLGPLTALALSLPHRYRFRPALDRLLALEPGAIAAVLEAVPAEWGLSSRRRQAALTFLLGRRERLPALARRLETLWTSRP
ncbi:MAG: hypothetical protein K6V97_12800 [Actinomycetia bacterium]|nr:hypothetical protein [Actinomycetes bacterium]